jgi:hypothetical protein
MATRWTTPDASTPTYKAMKMYRNYDGNKSTFGETSVAASVPDPDTLSSFAAVRYKDGALTVMVINKSLTASTQTNINIANFAAAGVAQVWQLTSANVITRLNDVNFGGNTVGLTVPAQSITLLVIGAAAPFLFTEPNSQRAQALESVNLLRDPLAYETTNNLSTDRRTRIVLLAGNALKPNETSAVVTAEAQDSQNNIYPMDVEFVGKVPGQDWLTQVVVKFREPHPSAGDYWITIRLHDVPSNKAFVTMKQ